MKEHIINLLAPYQRLIGYDQKYEWDKIALKYMKDCRQILDVGCGVGRFIGHDPKRISGVDHNEESLVKCRANDYRVKAGKVTDLPFENVSFDAVHCSHLIEHLLPKDAHKLLREMNRVLKVGGILCLRTPLLYPGFYHDFTHIKPYYPEAIFHYLRVADYFDQATLPSIKSKFKKVKLKYRRKQFFPIDSRMWLWPLQILFNILYRLGIRSFKRTGYMLILQKLS